MVKWDVPLSRALDLTFSLLFDDGTGIRTGELHVMVRNLIFCLRINRGQEERLGQVYFITRQHRLRGSVNKKAAPCELSAMIHNARISPM